MKIDNWLVKVRVVEEKKSIKIRNKTAVTDGTVKWPRSSTYLLVLYR